MTVTLRREGPDPGSAGRERGNARLKYWKVLATGLRCRPGQCTAVVKAVLAPHYMEHDPFTAVRAA